MKTFVYVTDRFEGFHYWPAAPESVSFLRQIHRHMFGVKLTVGVSHSDRDVEFFLLKKDLAAGIVSLQRQLSAQPSMSCEMMAQFIYEYIQRLGYKVSEVEVNEDGENGSILKIKQ